MKKIEPFGFEIDEENDWHYGKDGYVDDGYNGKVSINLPHQCDSWQIAYKLPIKEASKELERFIKEAQECLIKLNKKNES